MSKKTATVTWKQTKTKNKTKCFKFDVSFSIIIPSSCIEDDNGDPAQSAAEVKDLLKEYSCLEDFLEDWCILDQSNDNVLNSKVAITEV